MLLWAYDRPLGTLSPGLGSLLLILFAAVVPKSDKFQNVAIYAALISAGVALESALLVPRVVYSALERECIAGVGPCHINATLTTTSPPRYGMPGSAREDVRLRIADKVLRGVVTLPDLPWKELNPSVGSVVSGQLRIRRSELPSNHKFAWPSRDARNGIAFRGELSKIAWGESASNPLPLQLSLAERLIERFGYSRGLAVIISSSVGYGGLLDESTVDLFKQTGLYHVLIVSGSHVSFVYLIASSLCIWILMRSWLMLTLLRIKLVGMLLGGLAAALFVRFTGAEPPSVRALVALAVFVLAEALLRHAPRAETYLYVIGAMLVVFPGCFLDAGPILTFSAVLGLYVGFDLCKSEDGVKLNQRISRLRRMASRLVVMFRDGVIVSVAVWLFTAPWICLFFERISPVSSLFNLVFGGIFSGVVCLGGLVIGGLFALGVPVSTPIHLLCWFTELIIDAIAKSYEAVNSAGLGERIIAVDSRVKIAAVFLLLNAVILIFRGRKYFMLHRYCLPA
jgi:ComEC/Rec2-related protein